jgi:predicted Zn-dependent protease
MVVRLRIAILIAFSISLAACATNPVTGKRELTLIGKASEIQMGAQNYLPAQQSQGGQYDIDPALTQYVQDVGNRLAAVTDRQLPYEFVVLNNSVPNAWALPGGKIALNRGLLTELNSEAELAAVLGHEIVHAAARHSAKQMERGMLLQGALIATSVATSDSDYGNFAVGGASVAAQLLNQTYSRSAELESDKYGMLYMSRAGYDPNGAVSLQRTFVRLSEGHSTDWLSGLFASHPPSNDRVEANTAMAATLPAGGETGEDRFQTAMAKTAAAKPAYDAYDEGRKALADNNVDLAIEQANKAISLLPEESHFYALRGDVRLLNKQYDMAVTNFESALRRRDSFFYYYLQRGLVQEKLGNDDAAERDLEMSMTLLPTSPAHYSLGNIAARRGDKANAIEHYKLVAKGQGEIAEAAYASLVKLDLPDNPGNYVLRRCDPDSNGNLVVSVKNETPVVITSIAITVRTPDAGGYQRQVEGQLAPGQIASVNTRLGPYIAGSDCPATVTSARVAD